MNDTCLAMLPQKCCAYSGSLVCWIGYSCLQPWMAGLFLILVPVVYTKSHHQLKRRLGVAFHRACRSYAQRQRVVKVYVRKSYVTSLWSDAITQGRQRIHRRKNRYYSLNYTSVGNRVQSLRIQWQRDVSVRANSNDSK